jgi:hypothetical protein
MGMPGVGELVHMLVSAFHDPCPCMYSLPGVVAIIKMHTQQHALQLQLPTRSGPCLLQPVQACQPPPQATGFKLSNEVATTSSVYNSQQPRSVEAGVASPSNPQQMTPESSAACSIQHQQLSGPAVNSQSAAVAALLLLPAACCLLHIRQPAF